ncbi:MAG: PHP domain-containing protein [Clostridiales bacterium]|nr:PHP domain-containing protein [Clostridiales bacterium]
MKQIDLHTHSTGSDGTFTPAELVTEAKKTGLSAIALTDHDSTDGIAELMAAGQKYGIETIPGVELSTEYAEEEIHVVGLFIDPDNESLREQLRIFRDNRDNRNLKMIDRLREEGFDITAEAIYERNPDSVVARPHIARYLADTHQIPDIQTAFDRYIGSGCICYVERYKITPMRAVELIHEAGGLAVLAHPCLYKLSDETLLQMITEMKAVGLDGIEAVYSCNEGDDEQKYRRIAADFGLLLSGGSDFHGSNKPQIKLGSGKGNLSVPYEFLEELKRRHFTAE